VAPIVGAAIAGIAYPALFGTAEEKSKSATA
jgi:hypothetical protein